MTMFRRLSVKDLLYAMTGLVLATLLAYLAAFTLRTGAELNFLRKELWGARYIPVVQNVAVLLAKHRGAANMVLKGHLEARPALDGVRRAVGEAMATADRAAEASAVILGKSRAQWSGVRAAWEKLADGYGHTAPAASFEAHTRLIAEVLDFESELADQSNLILDPVLDTYYLMDNMVRALPALIESLGQLRGLGGGVIASGNATEEDRIELGKLAYMVQVSLRDSERGIAKVFTSAPELELELREPIAAVSGMARRFLELADRNVVNAPRPRLGALDYFGRGTEAIDSVRKLYDPVAAGLEARLEARAGRVKTERYLSIGGAFLTFVLTATLLGYVVSRITLPLSQAVACCREIGKGNYDFPIEPKYADEFGYLLDSARRMRDRLASVMETLRLAADVFEHSGEAIVITDARNRIVMVNQAAIAITGYAREELIGQKPWRLGATLGNLRCYRMLRKGMAEAICREGFWRGEIGGQRKGGEFFPARLTVSFVKDAEGRPAHGIGIFADISLEKKAKEQLELLAHFDGLTKLPNRDLLEDRIRSSLAAAKRRGHEMALLFIDLDRFKCINDTFGHRYGDLVLQAVAERLRGCVRDEDTVARLGGDEFVIFLPRVQKCEDAIVVANKALDSVAEPIVIDGAEFSVTPSIGIAAYPGDADDFPALLARADAAMYVAKKNGANRYEFFSWTEAAPGAEAPGAFPAEVDAGLA